ncbi:hypothetical protein [Paraburkholderia sp. BL23I1N1]|uniref:hypothetical protein n=1 Tax=Paraburkholderia sp. BL23I1N1 TaxID=1938802 RepID=UPI0011C3B381|nr:hypothetical protein [Paraburkholderia sp. BL23I1N1]
MLLPLPATISRDRTLGHHLALAALRAGNCNVELIGRLFRTLYIAYFVQEATSGPRDLAPFRISETALHSVAVCAKTGGGRPLSEADRRALEHVLLLHDEQLTAMPSHRIVEAEERLKRFLAADVLSPIAPDSDATPESAMPRHSYQGSCTVLPLFRSHLVAMAIPVLPTAFFQLPVLHCLSARRKEPTSLRHLSHEALRRLTVHCRPSTI